METWLSGCPVDMRVFNPIQIHLLFVHCFYDAPSKASTATKYACKKHFTFLTLLYLKFYGSLCLF